MRKKMTYKKYIMGVWQFPQYLLGYIIKKMLKTQFYCKYLDAEVFLWQFECGMSLGKYLFIPSKFKVVAYKRELCLKHEYGHTIQSKYLGWLYLFVIGLPSLVWATCFRRYRIKYGISYYDFYTEKSANNLVGMDSRR